MPPNITNPAAFFGLLALVMGIFLGILGSWTWLIIRLAEGRPLLPRAPRRVVPWGAASILAVIVLFVVVQSAVVLGERISGRAGAAPGGAMAARANVARPLPPPENPAQAADAAAGEKLPLPDMLLLNALAWGSLVFLVPPLLGVTSGARLADLGLGFSLSPGNVLRGVLVCLLLLPAVYAVSFASVLIWKPTVHPAAEALANDPSGPTVLVTAVAAVIVAPVSEELIFRGVLLGWLWKVASRIRPKPAVDLTGETFGLPVDLLDPSPAPIEAAPPAFRPLADWGANVVVSLLFAGLHAGQWPAPVPLFVLALGLGEVYRRTGSLLAPIALHATFNGLSTTAMILVSASGMKLHV